MKTSVCLKIFDQLSIADYMVCSRLAQALVLDRD